MAKEGLEAAHIFNRYGEAYRQAHGASLSAAQRRARGAIELCRTAAMGASSACDGATGFSASNGLGVAQTLLVARRR